MVRPLINLLAVIHAAILAEELQAGQCAVAASSWGNSITYQNCHQLTRLVRKSRKDAVDESIRL